MKTMRYGMLESITLYEHTKEISRFNTRSINLVRASFD
jgi:hypothetical protein